MGTVLELDAALWKREVLGSNILTVIDFWHENCPWCLMLDPIFAEIAEEYQGKIKFAKMNVLKSAENREIALHYGVTGTPTFLLQWKTSRSNRKFHAKRAVEENA